MPSSAGVEAVADLAVGAFQTLEGLFSSVPTFIGGQLDKVFTAALSSDIMSLSSGKSGAVPKARASLLSTAARKLPAKTLYPAIIRLHASLDGNARAVRLLHPAATRYRLLTRLVPFQPVLGLLDLLNRALRHGKTPDIVENYRIVFKLFLSVFDLRRVHSASLDENDITSIEENALGAFVQFILKLNEQLFRPLFLRTYDWAVIELADETDAQDGLSARRIVLYKIVDRLLAQLRVSSSLNTLVANVPRTDVKPPSSSQSSSPTFRSCSIKQPNCSRRSQRESRTIRPFGPLSLPPSRKHSTTMRMVSTLIALSMLGSH